MSDDKPMLNSPIETGITAGEEFEQNKIGRLDRLRAEMNITQSEPPEESRERLEKFREESFARIEQLTGLTFDRETGKCTTPVEARGDSRQFRERWRRV